MIHAAIHKLIIYSAFIIVPVMLTGCAGETSVEKSYRDATYAVGTAAVQSREFTHLIGAQGTWTAREFSMVPARVGGTMQELFVEDGETVTKGQALAGLDSEHLEHAVEAGRQDVKVAASSVEVARAQAEKAAANLRRAANDHRRFQALLDDRAVSEQVAEQAETQWISALAADKVAHAQISLADARLRQAETALAIAERNLRDTTISAPIDGAISKRFHELGEMVDAGRPVFRIDNPDTLEVSVFLAERYYPLINAGITVVSPRVEDDVTLPVSYRSPTVHEVLRTFEIKALWNDPPDTVVPGMMARMDIVLDKREGRGVPAEALVSRGDDLLVFSVDQGKARRHLVRTGYSTAGVVEILEGMPADVSRVIVSGQQRINDGDRVRVVDAEGE